MALITTVVMLLLY